MKKLQFNLIEILISFIVVLFSMFILISFFTISNKNTHDSSYSTTIANDANNIISMIKDLDVESDDDSEITLDSFADTMISVNTNKSQYPKMSDASYDKSTGIITFPSTTHLPLSFNTELIKHPSVEGAFLILHYEYLNETEKLIKLNQYEVRIWHSDFVANNNKDSSSSISFKDESLKSSATDSNAINYITSSKINIEFSWPLNKAYEDRKKKNLITIVNRFTKGSK